MKTFLDALSNQSQPKVSRLRLIKNLAVISTALLQLFLGFNCLVMLQSTMNIEKGVGVWSLATLYVCSCVSSLFLPPYFIKKIGNKMTILLTSLTFVPYIASNFYPHWVLMIPTSIILGTGGTIYWAAQNTYLNYISRLYAESVIEMRMCLEKDSFGTQGEVSQNKIGNISETIFIRKLEDNTHHHHKIDNKEIIKCLCHELVIHCANGLEEVETSNKKPASESCDEGVTSVAVANKSSEYETYKKKVIESTAAFFFGIHGSLYFSCDLWSNLISYFVLKEDFLTTASNNSLLCGFQFCNVEKAFLEQNIQKSSEHLKFTLNTICMCLSVSSALTVFLFLDPLEKENKDVSFSLQTLMAVCKLTKKKKCLLLVPLAFYIGLMQGFYLSDYNLAYVGCALGTYNVSLVAACYGAACGISCFLSGWLVKRLGRTPVFSIVAAVNVSSNILLILWQPQAKKQEIFFLFAALWGTSIGILWPQLRVFYGLLFKGEEEAAFSSFDTWLSLGFAVSFAYSDVLCMYVKIYLMMAVSLVSFSCYLTVEILCSKEEKGTIK